MVSQAGIARQEGEGMIYKCNQCGLKSEDLPTKLEAIRDLSARGCTWAIGYKTWCICGAVNSFTKEGEKE